jgi:hypothetical protein
VIERESCGELAKARVVSPSVLDGRPVSPGALLFSGFILDRSGDLYALCVHCLCLVQIFISSLRTISVCDMCVVCVVCKLDQSCI